MVEQVETEEENTKKIYLGGWRHVVTKVIYHNAESQTGPLARSNVENICSRAVQCIDSSDVSCQTSVHVATQMWRKDYYIQNATDKYLKVKPYETLNERQKKLAINDKAKIIQRAYRSWKMIRSIRACAKYYRKMIEDCKKYEEEKVLRDQMRCQLAIIRQTFPQSRADFSMIYGLIDKWKRKELKEIKEKNSLDVDTVREENRRIFKQHLIMLRNVEKHRQYVLEESKKKALAKFLTFHCKALKWNGYKGKTIEMVTLRVQKARELKSLYDNLCYSNCTVEDRVEMLILLRSALAAHNCCPAIDLLRLVDQEIMLLFSGIRAASLENLQKRISMAFLYFIRQSHDCCMDTNKAQEMELVGPIDDDKLLCRSCKRLLQRNKFAVHAGTKNLTKCRACVWMQQQNIDAVDYEPYNYLLNIIRADEQHRNSDSNLLYIIQDEDIYYLIKIIWHGRSIVSEIDDIFRLRLTRFHVNQEWSPWNCILLTEEESEVHYHIKDLNDVYSKSLLSRIYWLHEIAKSHFKDLIRIERKLAASHERNKIPIELTSNKSLGQSGTNRLW